MLQFKISNIHLILLNKCKSIQPVSEWNHVYLQQRKTITSHLTVLTFLKSDRSTISCSRMSPSVIAGWRPIITCGRYQTATLKRSCFDFYLYTNTAAVKPGLSSMKPVSSLHSSLLLPHISRSNDRQTACGGKKNAFFNLPKSWHLLYLLHVSEKSLLTLHSDVIYWNGGIRWWQKTILWWDNL